MKNIAYFFLVFLVFQQTSCSLFKKKTQKSKTTSKVTTISKKALLEKYSKILGENVNNEKLYRFIDEWNGVPYKFGGKSKAGIDCSNFSCELLRKVFEFPGNFYYPSSKLSEQGKRINKTDAKEGDVVCFSINKNSKISHVGIYLANNKFVHASTSSGVMINSLEEDYYNKRYVCIVRLNR